MFNNALGAVVPPRRGSDHANPIEPRITRIDEYFVSDAEKSRVELRITQISRMRVWYFPNPCHLRNSWLNVFRLEVGAFDRTLTRRFQR
jgi:hypothetical protein